jgi:uncharacterized membrane protein HdeD (DUF308 family)
MQLFLLRGLVALAWAAAFSAASDSLTLGAGVLLVLYPGIDVVASLLDARTQPAGSPARGLLRFEVLVSSAAAVALAIAATGTFADVLAVFGAWAAITGVAQVIVAVQRRRELGLQLPFLLSGGLSALVGLFYIGQALGDDPKLDVLSVYAAGGGVWFVLQAAVLAWRSRRSAVSAA